MPDEMLSSPESQDKPEANNSLSESGATPSSNWRELLTFAFWRRSWRYLIVFVPKCVLPACLVSIAMIVIVVGNVGFYGQIGRGATMNLNDLLTSAAVCLFANLVGLVLIVLGFGRWLFVLTIFCRYWFNLEGNAENRSLDLKELKSKLNQSHAEVKARGKYITQFWFRLFVVMLLPVLAVYLSAALKLTSSRNLVGGALFSLSPSVETALLVIIVLGGVFTAIVSFVSLPVAATADANPKESVKLVFSLTKRKFPQLFLLSLLVITANVILGGPLTFFRCSAWAALMPHETVPLCIAQEIWQGLSSIVLLPLSLVPFCQFMRNLIHEP